MAIHSIRLPHSTSQDTIRQQVFMTTTRSSRPAQPSSRNDNGPTRAAAPATANTDADLTINNEQATREEQKGEQTKLPATATPSSADDCTGPAVSAAPDALPPPRRELFDLPGNVPTPPPRPYSYDLPAPGHSFRAPRIFHPVQPFTWAPSLDEWRAATVGARNAQALLRHLEASKALWNSQYIAELCDRYQAYAPRDRFKPIIPASDRSSDNRLMGYTRAIEGCDTAIRGVKRSLENYACTFDRAQEFYESGETTEDILGRYVFNDEHGGYQYKRYKASPAPVASPAAVPVAKSTPPAAPSANAATTSTALVRVPSAAEQAP
ncbi:hypothetical protein EC968_008655 [Mortierella alpina]|nr:hypothetical protein EC968_008655 [Mortierella alpina]